MTATPDVSVLIPVRNEARHLEETVPAMLAQDLGGRTLELVFVDGRSDDGTRAVLEELGSRDERIRVLDNPARTTAAGLNVALRAARGRFVARMDAHAFFPARYLAAGIERLERSDDDVVWVAGPVVPRANGGWSGGVALALGTRLGVGGSRKWRMNGDGPAELPEETQLDTGVFAGVWRRATLDEHGGWDDGWPVNQDSELAARVIAGGGRIVCRSEMAAEYLPRATLAGLWRQYRRHGFYRAKTNIRHPGSLRRTHLLPPALVATAAAALLPTGPVSRPARVALGGYAAVVVATSIDASRRASLADAARLTVILPVMHVGWGTGFLAGMGRFRLLRAT